MDVFFSIKAHSEECDGGLDLVYLNSCQTMENPREQVTCEATGRRKAKSQGTKTSLLIRSSENKTNFKLTRSFQSLESSSLYPRKRGSDSLQI